MRESLQLCLRCLHAECVFVCVCVGVCVPVCDTERERHRDLEPRDSGSYISL